MYGNVLVFLIAIAIQALAPRGGEPVWTLSAAGHMVLYPVVTWAALRWRFRRLMAQALHDEAEAGHLRALFPGLVQTYQAVMLVPFAAVCYATDYVGLVVEPAAGRSEMLASVLGILPFVALLGILWWEAYPLHGVLLGGSRSRARFVWSHARMELPVLAPWVVLMALSDALRALWPAGYAALEGNPLLQLLYAPAFLALLGIFLPALVKAMWGCQPIEPGPLRDRLQALSDRLGLRVAEMLYWPLLEGRVLTAGIVGLVPRYRYLLITPALAEILTPEEIEGVVAHEAGHVRHHHLWIYLFFFVGYVGLVAVFFRLVEAALAGWGIADPQFLRNPRADLIVSASTTAGLLVLLVAYFRGIFGRLSRAFERQADLYSLEALGRPEPVVSALERVARYSGDIRDLPSWHHGSIAERVAFLWAAARDPAVGRAHHRRVRRLVAAISSGVVLVGGLAVALHTGPLDRGLNRFVAEQGLRHRVEKNPRDASAWFVLGNLYYEAGDEAKAEEAYLRVIRLDPKNAEALNNLAWMYVTTKDPSRYRPERALALAEMAVRLKPDPHILDTLAEARFRVRDFPGAVEAARAALARARSNRAYYEAQLRKFKAAAEARGSPGPSAGKPG
ncbi:TPR domain-containing protein [Deferrisoma sp.]